MCTTKPFPNVFFVHPLPFLLIFLRYAVAGNMNGNKAECTKKIEFRKSSIIISDNFLQVISSSVTSLFRPESDEPEEFRKHLPLPNIPIIQRDSEATDNKPEWRMIVDERVKKKTKRFVSVSSLPVV